MSEFLRVFGNIYPATPDGLILAYEEIRSMEKAVADMKRDITNRLVALAGDTEANTRHVKGESRKAVITMPAQAYNQTLLKGIYNGLDGAKRFFSIVTLRPLIKEIERAAITNPIHEEIENAKIAPYLLPTIKTSIL